MYSLNFLMLLLTEKICVLCSLLPPSSRLALGNSSVGRGGGAEAAAELLNKSRSQAVYLYDIDNEAAGDRTIRRTKRSL